MISYLVQPRDQTLGKGFRFSYFPKNFSKNINKNLSRKYSQKLLDYAKKNLQQMRLKAFKKQQKQLAI